MQDLVIKIHGNVKAQIHCLLNAGRGVNLLFHTVRLEASVIYCIICLLMANGGKINFDNSAEVMYNKIVGDGRLCDKW